MKATITEVKPPPVTVGYKLEVEMTEEEARLFFLFLGDLGNLQIKAACSRISDDDLKILTPAIFDLFSEWYTMKESSGREAND